MQNETSLRSLIYYEQVIRIAKRKGKRIYFLSSGFGEIHGNFAKLLLKRGLNDCSFCGCRTKRDLDIARKYTENSFLMPDLCFLLPEQNSKPQNKTFVWILSDKNTIKIEDVLDISRQRSLTPIAVNLFKDNDSASAVLAQEHGISVIAPKNYKELSETLRSADFSISERLHGSIFSIISHVPTFITESNEKNRALLEEIKSRMESAKIILPYAKNDVVAKKEIGACDSDFNYVIDSLKHDIHRAFHEIF